MPAYYNEHDPFAAAWLRELIKEGHIADGYVDERDIQDVTPGDLTGFTQCHFFAGIGGWSYALRLASWPDDRPVWTGSCPCQPFSSAGQRRGASDPRHLWPDFHRLIAVARPVTVFGEQVESKDGRAWLAAVQADLEGSGYTLGAVAAPAAGFGAPHGRHRLYWVAESMCGGTEYISREGMGTQATSDGQDGSVSQERLWVGIEGAFGGVAESDQHQRRQECAVAGRSGEGSRAQGMEQRPVHCSDEFMAHAQCPSNESRRPAIEPGKGDGAAGTGASVESGRCGNAGPLDNPPSPRRNPALEAPESQARDKARLRGFEPGCGDGGVAFPEHDGHGGTPADAAQPGSDRKDGGVFVGGRNDLCRVGKSDSSGSQPWDETVATPRYGDSAIPASFWSLCDWLPCRDGKLRPVQRATESELESLADGIPGDLGLVLLVRQALGEVESEEAVIYAPLVARGRNRIGRLRGYGNAIVPQVAQAFIEAYCEIELDRTTR